MSRILSTGGGVCLSACWDTTPLGSRSPRSRPPLEHTPPGADTPPEQAPPPCAVHAGRYGQQAGDMHPTGMHSCCWSPQFYWANEQCLMMISPFIYSNWYRRCIPQNSLQCKYQFLIHSKSDKVGRRVQW